MAETGAGMVVESDQGSTLFGYDTVESKADMSVDVKEEDLSFPVHGTSS